MAFPKGFSKGFSKPPVPMTNPAAPDLSEQSPIKKVKRVQAPNVPTLSPGQKPAGYRGLMAALKQKGPRGLAG